MYDQPPRFCHTRLRTRAATPNGRPGGGRAKRTDSVLKILYKTESEQNSLRGDRLCPCAVNCQLSTVSKEPERHPLTMDLFEQSPRSTILSGNLHSVPHLVSEETDGAVVSLEDFIRDVPAVIKERQVHEIPAGSEEDPIQRLFA